MSVSRDLKFDIIESHIRKKDYGILGTIDHQGFPHSTSVLYGVSSPIEKFAIYVVTGRSYKKTKNIERNPNISFVIPYPHHIFRFVPSNCIQFQGIAKILPITDKLGIESFQKNRVLRMTADDALNDKDEYVLLKIIPKKVIFGYGIGMSIVELRDNHESGSFRCVIPNNRID